MRCPRCLADGVPDGATFCPGCGTPLVARAPDRRAATAAPPPSPPPAPSRPAALPGPQAWTQRVSPLVYIEGNDLPQASRRTTVLVALAFAFVATGVWLVMSSQPSSANWSPAAPPALSPVGPRPVAESTAGPEPTAGARVVVSRPPRPRAVATPRAPTPRAAPPPSAGPPPADPPPEPAVLSVSAWPWGTLSLDGRPVGDTPVLDLQVSPGPHRVRIERDGFQPFERLITVAPGQNLKLTGIALEERPR
jgi:hypothetical protein